MITGKYFYPENLSGVPCSLNINQSILHIHYVEQDKIGEIKWAIDKLNYKAEDQVIIIYNTDFQNHKLIISEGEKDWKKITKTIDGRNVFQLIFSKLKKSILTKIAVISALILGFFAFIYFIGLSFLAGLFADFFPRKYEVKMGEVYRSNILENSHLDSAKTIAIQAFFKELHYPSKYEINLDVVEDKEVNAFAMPGGFMVINTGIIDKMKTYEELAAVIAHELTHINQRHTTKSIFKSLSNYLFLSLLLGDATAIIGVIADHANELNNLSYSRSLELEADNEGMKLMIQERIDIHGMIRLFQVLKLEEKRAKSSNEIMKLLSTHPLTEDRIKNATESSLRQKNAIKSATLEKLFLQIKNQ